MTIAVDLGCKATKKKKKKKKKINLQFHLQCEKKSKIEILFVIVLYVDLLLTSASDLTLFIGVIPKCVPWQTVKTQMKCVISCMGESFQD